MPSTVDIMERHEKRVAHVDKKQTLRLLDNMRGRMGDNPLRVQLWETCRKFVELGAPTLVPILPCLLNLKGQPFTLDKHFPFEPFYNTIMPQRIALKTGRQVSKSTNLAVQGIISSNCISHFNTLYITPLYETVRKFSTNYVRGFINQSPFKKLWTDASTSGNVLQRSFRNNSTMFFSYAFQDADRTRGINADRLVIDESVRSGTMVFGPTFCRPIETLVPGDKVYAFDEEGRIAIDEVKTCSHHGYRDCYRFEFENGAFVEATSDSFLATTEGWKRTSTIIEDLVRQAAATAVGDDVGGWESTATKNCERYTAIPQSARLRTAFLQHGEVPDLIRVRKSSTQENEELRLRKMVKSLANQKLPRATPYSFLVLPVRKEASQPGMAQSTNLGGNRLVVPGRRKPTEKSRRRVGNRNATHPGLLRARGRLTSQLASNNLQPQRVQAETKTTSQEVRILLDHQAGRTKHSGIHRERPAVRRVCNELQGRVSRPQGCGALQLVQPYVSTSSNTGSLRREQESAVLRPYKLSEKEAEGCRTKIRQRPAQQSRKTCQASSSIQNGSVIQTLPLRKINRVERGQSGAVQGYKAKTLSQKTSRAAATGLDLSTVRTQRTARRERSENQVLFRVPQNRNERDKVPVRCELSSLVKVTWTGKHEVYDIETAKHHTFFAGGVAVHNCQDMDKTFLPILQETLSGSVNWGLEQYAGTPKTMDGMLEELWSESSQGEWCMTCPRCHKDNYPCLGIDLEKMIGKDHPDISPGRPGIVCAGCDRPIDPASGRWHHRYPERIMGTGDNLGGFAGYHVPQIIMPMHYADRRKWNVLLAKRQGRYNTGINVFYNEVCGESYDMSAKLVSETDLKRACCLGHANTIEEAMAVMHDYEVRVISADWGGGGSKGTSWTVFAVMGWRGDGHVDVIYGYRSLQPYDADAEALIAIDLINKFKPHFFVHDFNGAGRYREQAIINSGYPYERVIPMWYVPTMAQKILKFVPESEINARAVFRLDKPRSLMLTCSQIRHGKIRFFKYDNHGPSDKGVVSDFLALVEDKIDSRLGRDIYTIIRQQNASDDFAHAVNMGAIALYERMDNWPNLSVTARYAIDNDFLQLLSPGNPEWN